eukprot:CAMPEP_0173389892 /NCGR_PEP_ID=MMETSP1356-20130122/13876_1 /TAXON_ID=77927 ORGANISM="Hemiselmis virescens, Strain PCC157" /NCGR_SAMPLE_ID=MMETSP1356 /ASSEMBLY_ACC=CAM_ASM_000847 /LENGTH=65 /DNA_ID=CAMNT_0014347171 /DNA_START=107 /DNA_END=304 /DNA_ORIENTATION=-
MVVRKGGLQTVRNMFYNTVYKHNSTGILFVLGGAILGETVIDNYWDNAWNKYNKGKLAKDILPAE